jgi:alginate O-acetyltransferase complex protein AlgI
MIVMTIIRETAFAAFNIAVVASLVPFGSLWLFFAVCLLFVVLRGAASPKLRVWVRAGGIVVAIVLLLYYKSSPLVFNRSVTAWVQATIPGSEAWYATQLLSTLGVSYCFLRFVYALVDDSVTPWRFTRYYFFFPTFFSGPIMAPGAFLDQSVSFGRDDFHQGLTRIVYGLLKFAASSVMQMVIPLSTLHHADLARDTYPIAWQWVTLFLTGVWLYLNFSAFADMSIGAARLFGFRVPENFDRAFTATNLADFWRRWHMTLSDWLRANVFNPLARGLTGVVSPNSILVAIAPALFTMLACGLWHRTTTPYLVWGLMHGAGLAVHQLWRRYARPLLPGGVVASPAYRVFSWMLTHAYISLSWVFFFPVDVSSYRFHRDYLLNLLGVH